MPAYVLVSAKGSPGVTTAATALAAVASSGGRAILAELDPSGGSVSVLTGQPAVVGLVEAAGLLRRATSAAAIDENATMVPPGIATLLAPSSGPVAESVIGSITERWVGALRTAALDVVVDGGRWEPSQPTARRIHGADLLVVVVRATVASIEASRHIVDRLRETAKRPAAALVVGNKPYRPEEVAAHLDLPLAGMIAWDPRGAATLWASGVSRGWMRTMLARSAAGAWAGLYDIVSPPTHYGQPAQAQSQAQPQEQHQPRHAQPPPHQQQPSSGDNHYSVPAHPEVPQT
jgi:Flp pilus assembly CpaE family ATPase